MSVKKTKTLKQRFEEKWFTPVKYARVHRLSRPILSHILNGNGEITGTRRTQKGTTRKIYAQLKKDGVWIGRLPWENEDVKCS